LAYGLLLLRLVTGLALAAHGSQKLFGWFDGPGPGGTRKMLSSMRFRVPLAFALAAGLGEAGGLLFAAGLLTPLAALGIAVVMLNAVATTHWKNGFFTQNKGFEYNLVLVATALAVTATGPGRLSLDAVFGLDWLSGVVPAAIVLLAAVVITVVGLTAGRRPPEATRSEEQRRAPDERRIAA
jgi:putative oxidoreductase